MILRAVLLLSLLALAACAACAAVPRPLPRAEVPAVAEPLDPSIKPLVQEQEEQAG